MCPMTEIWIAAISLVLIIGSNPPVPQTDIFGIPIAVPKTDAFGFPLLRPLTDAYNHLPITDNQGSTFLVPVPSNGSHPTPQPETDAFHNPVLVPKTDVYGQPVTDKSGNPIMVPKPYSQVTPTTTPQASGSTPKPGKIVCNQGWTFPMNADSPTSGAGDEETLSKLRTKFSFCREDDIVAVKCTEVGSCDTLYILLWFNK